MDAIRNRLAQLEQYKPSLTAAPDLADYWERTLQEQRDALWERSRQPVETPLLGAKVYKAVFEGSARTPLHGWFLVPELSFRRPCPCIVSFHGYTGSKGQPEQYAPWLMMGFAVLAVDVRGQGGETGNRLPQEFGMTKGWITQGILDRDTCYYKAITLDALRAVQYAKEQPDIDPERIIVMGTSQGGGLALITAALEPDIRATVAAVPNMCHMDYGLLLSTGALSEAAEFINRFPDKLETVLTTFSYFDMMNLADRITGPVLCTVGLKDTICMPEMVYAAYNRIASPQKRLQPYPFLGHALGPDHLTLAYEFIREHIG